MVVGGGDFVCGFFWCRVIATAVAGYTRMLLLMVLFAVVASASSVASALFLAFSSPFLASSSSGDCLAKVGQTIHCSDHIVAFLLRVRVPI